MLICMEAASIVQHKPSTQTLSKNFNTDKNSDMRTCQKQTNQTKRKRRRGSYILQRLQREGFLVKVD